MMTTNNHYLYSRNGTFYYSRRIPLDLQDKYSIKRIVISLRTRSRRSALMNSANISSQLEGYWSSIRVRRISSKFVHEYVDEAIGSYGTTLSDAKDLYLRLKGIGKPKIFHQVATRNIQYVIDSIGDKDLTKYTTAEAATFRDALLGNKLSTSSIKRIFSTVKAIVTLAIGELGIGIVNPFSNIFIPNLDDAKKRKVVTIGDIKKVQRACVDTNDDLRWMMSIISDTGLRLGEAAGLRSEDVVINDDNPHLIIRPNNSRRLKTKQSERVVPLIGQAYWGAQQAVKNKPEGFLFDRYNKTGSCNANSASATLNKWLKPYVEKDVVIHSFRHSMRDRLRAVECPKDIVDAIGGWSSGSIGEGYGDGYPISILSSWLRKIQVYTP